MCVQQRSLFLIEWIREQLEILRELPIYPVNPLFDVDFTRCIDALELTADMLE